MFLYVLEKVYAVIMMLLTTNLASASKGGIHVKECGSLVCDNSFKGDEPLYQSVHKKGRVHSISIGDKLMYSIKTRLSPFMFK